MPNCRYNINAITQSCFKNQQMKSFLNLAPAFLGFYSAKKVEPNLLKVTLGSDTESRTC